MPMLGKALCLPMTIGSTTGAILGDVWTDAVQTGDMITVAEDVTVTIE